MRISFVKLQFVESVTKRWYSVTKVEVVVQQENCSCQTTLVPSDNLFISDPKRAALITTDKEVASHRRLMVLSGIGIYLFLIKIVIVLVVPLCILQYLTQLYTSLVLLSIRMCINTCTVCVYRCTLLYKFYTYE